MQGGGGERALYVSVPKAPKFVNSPGRHRYNDIYFITLVTAFFAASKLLLTMLFEFAPCKKKEEIKGGRGWGLGRPHLHRIHTHSLYIKYALKNTREVHL